MPETLGSPHPATVIAIGLKARLDDSPSLPATRRIFANLLGGTLAYDCHIQPASGPGEELAFTAIVPDTTQSLSLIRRLLSVQSEFRGTHPDTAARFIVHHGVVFPSDKGYIGSALRSAHSRLSRLPLGLTCAATTDFAAYTETWASHPIVYHKQEAVSEALGLLSFSISQPAPEPAESTALHDPNLLRYLTSRLANHLGPFAEVLVDAAQRSSSTPRQLIEELSSEIEDAKARQDFRKDAQDFLYSQSAE